MNLPAKTSQSTSTMVATDQQEIAIRSALKSSLYPGASDSSIEMVLAYCRAGGYDPMMKPVHIVPMSVKTGEKDQNGNEKKAMRDVVMPGIGLYRTNASRTNQYAGCTEPEFGPTAEMEYTKDVWEDGPTGKRVKRSVSGLKMKYPEWCRITVTKVVDGVERHFTAKEYWLENYATKSGDSQEPNAMWLKRPFAQLAKCTEAQALRKAFPEQVGSQPTADEMEGKVIDIESIGSSTTHQAVAMPSAKQSSLEVISDVSVEGEIVVANATATNPLVSSHANNGPGIHGLSDSQMRVLLARAKGAGIEGSEGLVQKFDRIDLSNLNAVLNSLRAED